MMSSPMIRIQDLKKNYGLTQALRGVSFEVPSGQVVGFLGPNGAGKSTTMKILAGYVNASSGMAQVGGLDVAQQSLEARRRVGYLPENNPLYEDMMVIEFLNFIADVRGLKGEHRRKRLAETVERCGLTQKLGSDIGQLSKGYRQRVGLAQAILHDPDLLILDEPTSGLDPNQIVEIRNLIKELGQQKTVILSTHILSEVQSTCGRVLIINDGRIVADDTPEQLSHREGGKVNVVIASRFGAMLDANRVRSELENLAGVSRVENQTGEGGGTLGFLIRYSEQDPRREIFETAVKNEWLLLEMRHEFVSLEETFRKLTASESASVRAPAAAA